MRPGIGGFRAAMRHLAQEAGVRLVQTIDDSTNFQIWGSELYRQGRRLDEARAHRARRWELLAAAPRLAASLLWVRWLNRRDQGDQAAFVLEK